MSEFEYQKVNRPSHPVETASSCTQLNFKNEVKDVMKSPFSDLENVNSISKL